MTGAGRPTVGVMGSGTDEHPGLAEPVGKLLARLDVNLLTGGGGGVMTSVSRAFVDARKGRGLSIGVLRCESLAHRDRPYPGSPNPYVDVPILTHLPFSGARGIDDLSRNHINVLSSNAIVALPGGHGTASEVRLAVRYGRPVVAFGAADTAAKLPPGVDRLLDVGDLEAFLRRHLALPGAA